MVEFRDRRACITVKETIMTQKDFSPSGVGVIDKAVQILDGVEAGPATLAQLVETTGIARPTLHRLAAALIHHGILARDEHSRYVFGSRLSEIAAVATEDRIAMAAMPILNWLRDNTGESTQLYRRHGDVRICVASAERPVGLRDTIPVGSQFSMRAGSAAQILLAWDPEELKALELSEVNFSPATLNAVRRRGWAESVGEREDGVASVSAPVRGRSGRVEAAISISGPVERLSRTPGRQHSSTVVTAARRLSEVLRND